MLVKDMAATTDAAAPPDIAAAVLRPSAHCIDGKHALPTSTAQAAVAEHTEAIRESDPEQQRAASIGSESTQSIGGNDIEMQP